MLGELARRFPDHAVLAEESGDHAGGGAGPAGGPAFRWVVDPLDGTTNFAHGLPFFCVSIALEVDGRRALGVIHDPMRDECFAARAGAGATLNGAPIAVSRAATLERALGGTGFPYDVNERPADTLRWFVADAAAAARRAPAGLGGARPGLRRVRPARPVLGAEAACLGRGRGHPDRRGGGRLRHRLHGRRGPCRTRSRSRRRTGACTRRCSRRSPRGAGRRPA